MSAAPSLSPEGEAAWLRLKRHMEWSDCFGLVFVFSDRPVATAVLRDRLAAVYRARVTGLEVPVPRTPEALLQDLLPRLLRRPMYSQALDAPVWLDLTRLPAGSAEGGAAAEWQEARLQFLARLNEQREPLRHALTRPLILVLPLAEKARVKALVPDLWAIRQLSLETGDWLVPAERESVPDRAGDRPEPFALTEADASLVEEWRRVREQGEADRGALLAGGRAFDVLWRRGRLDEARVLADWLAATARSRLRPHPDEPEALRDLSVSLNNVGKTERALGDLDGARAAFAESLEIRRRLLARLGETPEALRDLSVSLDNVGDTERALGDLDGARAAFAEALEIGERLARALPNHVDFSDLPRLFEQRLIELEQPGVQTQAPAGTQSRLTP